MDPDRPIVRWTLIVLWVLVGLTLWEPTLALVSWPMILAALISAITWTVGDFRALGHQTEVLPSPRMRAAIRIELAVTCIVAALVVVFATTVSMDKLGRDIALSTTFAPVLLSTVLVAALAAMRRPNPRRIALCSLAALATYPLLASVRIAAIPFIDMKSLFMITQPWVQTGYIASVVVLGALGLHLGIVARKHGLGDEIPAPPPRALLRISGAR